MIGPEKLINSILFVTGFNQLLELICNWTAEVILFNSETLDNPENLFVADLRISGSGWQK